VTQAAVQLQDVFGVGRRLSRVLVYAFLVGAVVFVAVMARIGMLERAATYVALGLAILVSFRWPLASLYVFVGLIPVEAALGVGDFGTLSRYAGLLFAATYALPRVGRLAIRAMPLPGWIFIAWATLSLTWAIDSAVGGTAVSTLIQLFVIAVLTADVIVQRPTLIRPLLWVYTISAAGTGLLGIDAYLTGVSATGRVSAFATQDVAQFAAILLPALVFSLNELLRARLVPLSALAAAICTMGIVVSGTRGAWLSAIVVVVLFTLPRLRPLGRIAAVGIVALLLVLSFQLPGVSDLVSRRTATAVQSGGAGRTDIWTVAITIIGTSPVIGVGYGNFPVAFTPEQIAASDVGAYLANDESARGPHSILFGSLTELGVVGLVPLVLFLLPLVLRRGWGPEGSVVQTALISLLISSLFLDILNRKQLWLIIGMAAGLVYLEHRKRRLAAQLIDP